MTAAAIARLAGVGRAAVSNWRRRYPEFPKPIGESGASPTFSQADVMAWLVATGKADQLATAGRTRTGTQALGDSSTPWTGAKNALARRGWGDAPERALTDLTSGQLLAKVMVSLLPRSITDVWRVDADDVEEAEVPAVLDPACFDATLLAAVADRFGDQVRLVGQEIDEAAASLAGWNLRGSPHDVPYEIYVGDSLLDNRLSGYLGAAAAVVCEPPLDQPQWPSVELAADPRWKFGVPEPRDSELAWVQHCYAHLRPRGVAVVAVSPRTCVQPSGRRIRAELVRSGVLRDVIALPKGMGSVPGTDVYLWVLQRSSDAAEQASVHVADLSRLADPAAVPHDYAAWQQLFANANPAVCRVVPRVELLEGDTSLLPSRHVLPRVDVSADGLARVTERLQALYAQVGRGLPRFDASRSSTHLALVALGELERGGALTICSRDTTPRKGDLLLRTLGRPPAVATGTSSDDDGIAQVVELDETRLDAHFVATFLRADAAALPLANTLGALSRDDLRRCRVPSMSLAEQRRYGDAFRHLQELEGVLAAMAKVSANVIDQTIHGLTTGVLAPDLPSLKNIDGSNVTEGETRKL